MTVHVPPWLLPRLEAAQWLRVLRPDTQTAIGVSGGRSSAMLWALTALAAQAGGWPMPVGTFQNTGEEHPSTISFLRDLHMHVAPVVCLEYRPPARVGGAPRESSFVVVSFDDLSMQGQPFDAFLQALADYRREVKGLGPTAPWARKRICTAYMKIKTQAHYLRRELGWQEWEAWAGLRADEPSRVRGLTENEWRSGGGAQAAPLAELGISKADVYRFWQDQPFDLAFQGRDDALHGNCEHCFLKDEADLSRSLDTSPEMAERWIQRQARFGSFRPRGRPTYPQLQAEARARRIIQTTLEEGEDPDEALGDFAPAWWSRRRRMNVIRQETQRHKEGPSGFSCHCEAAETLEDEDILAAPESTIPHHEETP